jgi:hypothetical protein
MPTTMQERMDAGNREANSICNMIFFACNLPKHSSNVISGTVEPSARGYFCDFDFDLFIYFKFDKEAA